jgi:hypothetical protein
VFFAGLNVSGGKSSEITTRNLQVLQGMKTLEFVLAIMPTYYRIIADYFLMIHVFPEVKQDRTLQFIFITFY